MFCLNVTGDIKENVRVPDRGIFGIKNGQVYVTHMEMVSYLINNGDGRDGMKFEQIDKKFVPDFNTITKAPPVIKLDGPKPKVSISVLMCNRAEYSMACVSSIITSKTNIEYEIILTDNGSTDNGVTKKYLEELDNDKIVKVFHKNNLGFIKGHEHALTIAKNEIFLMLNNDCVVCDNWLDKIVDGFKDPMVRAVGNQGALIKSNGEGVRSNLPDFDYLEGSCIALPSSFIKVFELFDPEYKFCYGEDFDLCMRLRRAKYKLNKVSIDIKHDRHVLTIDTLKEGRSLAKLNQTVLFRKWGDYIKDRNINAVTKRDYKKSHYIMRTGANGDVLYVLPIAKHIKTMEPTSEVIVETVVPNIITDSPYIDRTVLPENHEENHKNIIDLNLAHESRPTMSIMNAYEEVYGHKVQDLKPELPFDEATRLKVKNEFPFPYLVAHWGPSPGWDGRNVDVKFTSEVTKKVIEKGFKVVEIGHKKNCPDSTHSSLNKEWKYNIELLRNSCGYIGIDSVIMHIAQCVDAPGVAVFGCVDPKTRLLKDSSIKPLYDDKLECKFCWNKHEPPMNAIKCKDGKQACMKNLKPIDFIKLVVKTIGDPVSKSLFVNKNNIELKNLKLDWGCGFRKEPGYVGVDIQDYPQTDIICDINDLSGFPDNCVEEIRSLHFFEHEEYEKTDSILKSWQRILKPKGKLFIFYPDMSKIMRKVNQDRACDHAFGQHLNEFDVHKSFWTPFLICKFLKEAGYKKVEDIEYTGGLHKVVNLTGGSEQSWTSGVKGEK